MMSGNETFFSILFSMVSIAALLFKSLVTSLLIFSNKIYGCVLFENFNKLFCY